MLVTFRTKRYANITMFGDVALRLIRMMGHSGTIPSAIRAEDVPAALARLKAGVAEHGEEPQPPPGEGSGEQRVSLAQRAFPLVELLEAAVAAEADVSWDS